MHIWGTQPNNVFLREEEDEDEEEAKEGWLFMTVNSRFDEIFKYGLKNNHGNA